jgi:hypothetical protein
VVLGERTFGKGSMQQTLELSSWPGEPFEDIPQRNGLYDWGERYQDGNGNGRWDPGEPFEDSARPNGRYDEAEAYEDTNGNGKHDGGEPFTDDNQDGIWNAAERFTDTNGNGRYDNGAAMKFSVARYYLPDGRNFTRTRVWDDAKKAYAYKGGVEPDVPLEAERMELSVLVEYRHLQEDGIFRGYVEERWTKHHDLLTKLAFYDGRDTAAYPDFDAFYEGLRTRLSKQEVRRGLRFEARRRVSMERAEEIYADLSDDNVLLRGVTDVLRRLEIAPDSVPEYKKLIEAYPPQK